MRHSRLMKHWILKLSQNLDSLLEGNGAPEKIRTPDPLVRSQVLYPAELRALFERKKSLTN